MMTVQQKVAMAMDAYNKIFASKQAGVDITTLSVIADGVAYRGRWFTNSVTKQKNLRGFDVVFIDEKGRRQVRLIEQNPNKDSKPGRRAYQGAKIMQVIEQNNFLFCVEEGKIDVYKERAVRPAGSGPVATPQRVSPAPIFEESRLIVEEVPVMHEEPSEATLRYFESQEAPIDEYGA